MKLGIQNRFDCIKFILQVLIGSHMVNINDSGLLQFFIFKFNVFEYSIPITDINNQNQEQTQEQSNENNIKMKLFESNSIQNFSSYFNYHFANFQFNLIITLQRMQKYKLGKGLGDGAFGSVTKAINQNTGQVVAIKRMKKKYSTWEQCEDQNQVKVLKKLHHPNIITLYELIKYKNQLYFVFQYMQRNVYQMLRQQQKLPQIKIRNVLFQVFQALAYMHRHGYFHRDLKPQNFLQMNGTVKLADFGLVRQIRAKPPFTQYVSTRWYRSPQVLLRSRNYNSPMDIFAMGTIMAELYTGMPLFPGCNERDQIQKIFSILGCPSKQEWPDGYKLASTIGIEITKSPSQRLNQLIPNACPEAINLLESLLQINPQKRPTAQQVIHHEYFQIKEPNQKPIIKLESHQHIGSSQSIFQNVKYKPGTVCRQ